MHEQPPIFDYNEAAPDVLEQDTQASLFEHYADTVFEIYGQRGTLRQLLDTGGCPVPPHERSFAATERFTAKLAERSGLDIPEQFSHLRSPDSTEARQAESAKSEKLNQPAKTLPSPKEASKFDQEPVVDTIAPVSEMTAMPMMSGGPSESEKTTELIAESQTKVIPTTPDIKPNQRAESKSNKATTLPPAVAHKYVPKPVVASPTLAPMIGIAQPEITQLFVSSEVDQPLATPEPTIELAQAFTPMTLQYLGELYESAALESAEAVPIYREFDTTDEAIAEVLNLPFDAITADGPSYPEALVSTPLNVLSKHNHELQETISESIRLPIMQILPEEITSAFVAAVELLPAEEAEQATNLVETMSLIAERLHVLVSSERGETAEAIQIVQVIEEYYDQLYSLLGLPVDEVERTKFIASISSEAFQQVLETEFQLPNDEGTHEFKRVIINQAHQLPVLWHQTVNLTRYIMKLGVNQSTL